MMYRDCWREKDADILPVKIEAKLSASEVQGEVVGSSEKDLLCRSLFTVCDRHLGLSEAEDTWPHGLVLFWKTGWALVVLVADRLEGGLVNSRVSAFPEVFGTAGGGRKGADGGSKPSIDGE